MGGAGRQMARKIIRRGIAPGELGGGLDAVVLDILDGPHYHRLLVPYDGAPISEACLTMPVDTVFGGRGRRPRRREGDDRRRQHPRGR